MHGPDQPVHPASRHPPRDEQPLELILARNLISIISIAALLVDSDGRIVFFNEAAAEIIGAPFEEPSPLDKRCSIALRAQFCPAPAGKN